MSTEFKWDDESVMEFYNFHRERENQWTSESIQQFKKSKQPNPEWEIISYRHKQTKEITPKISTAFHKAMFNNEHEIFSVNRLSDGEVFTIGDRYRNDSGMKEYTIREFEIRNGGLRANATEHGFDYFSDLIKIKNILFTTEDGVKIHEGDRVWFVSKSYKVDFYDFIDMGDRKNDLKSHPQLYVYFSTEANANEYALMNKPLFSIQEIHDFLNIGLGNYNLLREKAKEKLNKP